MRAQSCIHMIILSMSYMHLHEPQWTLSSTHTHTHTTHMTKRHMTAYIKMVHKNVLIQKQYINQSSFGVLGRTDRIMAKGCVLHGCTWVLCWHKVAHEWCCFVDCQSSVTCVLHKYWHHLIFLWVARERWKEVGSDHGWYYRLVQAILLPLEALLLQEC